MPGNLLRLSLGEIWGNNLTRGLANKLLSYLRIYHKILEFTSASVNSRENDACDFKRVAG